ncbi:hypothetical protein FQA39_LY04165 [Lamprigera yunnana]|nr:hypothetical protein FQA39_LY04165 [Lamprigera yunnana]
MKHNHNHERSLRHQMDAYELRLKKITELQNIKNLKKEKVRATAGIKNATEEDKIMNRWREDFCNLQNEDHQEYNTDEDNRRQYVVSEDITEQQLGEANKAIKMGKAPRRKS